MKKSVFLIVFLIHGMTQLLAQDNPDPSNYTKPISVLSPTPNASSLGKYGGIPINLSSGDLNLSIPLYNYASTSLAIPITISYNSSSIRVNDIASSVGMSWAMNAGGVITRTVFGMADEFKPRVSPPSTFPAHDTALRTFLYNLGQTSLGIAAYDGQPDLFSFSFAGTNGKFILDSTLTQAQLLTYSGIKIESRLGQSSASDWHFKITTTDGIQYFFGGTAIERSKSKDINDDAVVKNLIPESPTAFYLNEIVHPNHDTIWLSYIDNSSTYIGSVSESMFSSQIIASGGEGCSFADPVPLSNNTPKSYSYFETTGLIIKQITSSGGAKLIFNYSSRKDIDQNLLSSIQIFQPGKFVNLKKINFDYEYAVSSGTTNIYETDSSYNFRPFLTRITESSPDSTNVQAHQFRYNDKNGLPPRLSYAQDHYGFFNGKYSNSTLIPAPTHNLNWQQYFPGASANREIDTNYCLKGLLTNVVYPTGGQDSIVYEPNYAYTSVAVQPSVTTAFAEATGSVRFGTPVYDTIILQYGQSINLVASCFYTEDPENPDPAHDLASLTLYSLDEEGNPSVYFQTTMAPGESYHSLGTLVLNAGTYIMELKASGIIVAASASLDYRAGALSFQFMNQVVGGNRVKKIVSIDPISGNKNIKRYYYGKLESLQNSSNHIVAIPNYEKVVKFFSSCSVNNPSDYTFNEYDYASIYSNTQLNIDAYGFSPVSYSAVTESFGENFENGGVEHDFTNIADEPGQIILGDEILSAPKTSYAYLNGREVYQFTFKNLGGTFVPVRKQYTSFRNDVRIDTSFSSFLVSMKFSPIAIFTPPDTRWEFGAFDLMARYYLKIWMYPDTVRTYVYDDAGANYRIDTAITQYDNPAHALPTKTIQTRSDGGRQIVSTAYPSDLTLAGAPETARLALVSDHITSPVIRQVETIAGDTTFVESTDYKIFSSGLTLPNVRNLRLRNHPIEPRLQLIDFTTSGRLLEQSKIGDAHESYVWDYRSMFPIAKVTNGAQSEIAYTSFEADATGNWTIGATSRDTVQGITGTRSYVLNSDISKTSLTSSITYIVSYWTQNSSPFSITGTISGYPVKGKTVNGWTFYLHKVTGQTTISLSGAGHIDELRLYPATAQMTTYTYIPLVGMTSQCDVNNRITYYEYDGLQRLKQVRDQDYNILKSLDYQYQAASGCGGGCYILTMQTRGGTNTLSYPVGVFNVKDTLLGNATNQAAYISLWNADTANAHIGNLSAGADSMHFQLALNSGKIAPSAVTGCRYYQYDVRYSNIDGIRNLNGCYVDFGDSIRMRLGEGVDDTTVAVPPFTELRHDAHVYLIHTYPDTSLKTITLYHNDAGETLALDNWRGPATSMLKLSNLRGYCPQYASALGGSCYQNASALTIANLINWNSISSIRSFILNPGDNVAPCLNVSYAQDFMQHSKGLNTIFMTRETYYASGCRDTTFTLSRLKSDWSTYFTELTSMDITDEEWTREDLSHLTKLTRFVLVAGNQHHSNNASGNPVNPLLQSVVDSVLIQIAAGAGQIQKSGTIKLYAGGTLRSSASDTAVALLSSQGWAIFINGVNITSN